MWELRDWTRNYFPNSTIAQGLVIVEKAPQRKTLTRVVLKPTTFWSDHQNQQAQTGEGCVLLYSHCRLSGPVTRESSWQPSIPIVWEQIGINIGSRQNNNIIIAIWSIHQNVGTLGNFHNIHKEFWLIIGRLQVNISIYVKASLPVCAKSLLWISLFIHIEIGTNITKTTILHLDWLWMRDWGEEGSLDMVCSSMH